MTPPTPPRVARRAAETFTVVGECWVSTYSTTPKGYARMSWSDGGRPAYTYAHRAAFVHHTGRQIQEGMTVDHLCGTRNCVRPDHLRELTLQDNSARTHGEDWPLGECRNGHPNVHRRNYSGRWRCSICYNQSQRKKDRKRYARMKALKSGVVPKEGN